MSVFTLFGTKTPNVCKAICMGKKQKITSSEKCLLGIFQGVRNQNVKKKVWEAPYVGIQNNIKKEKCILSAFKSLPYKNGETHTKEPLHTNRILPNRGF